MLKTIAVGVAGLAATVLTSCASPDRDDQPSPPPEALRAKTAPGLFISPSGQPFRSAPGEPYPVAKWFARLDKNGDGRVNRKEFRADAEAFFQVLDRNHDGVIDGFELSWYEHNLAPEILGAYRGGGAGDAPSGAGGGRREHGRRGGERKPDVLGLQGASAYELFSKPEPVAAADLNFDGHITRAEFLTMADRDFDTLDPTGRGYLTLAGLPKTPLQTAMEGGKKPKH